MSARYGIDPRDAETLADAAAEVQSNAPDAETYAYCAGVEDALRFVLSDVSARVFAGFSPTTEPFRSGGEASVRELTEVAERFDR